jgi:hypothetical protein
MGLASMIHFPFFLSLSLYSQHSLAFMHASLKSFSTDKQTNMLMNMNSKVDITQTDRLEDWQTGRQADRQTGRQADRQTGRQADWQTDRQTMSDGHKYDKCVNNELTKILFSFFLFLQSCMGSKHLPSPINTTT